MNFKTLKAAVTFSATINILLFTAIGWMTEKNLKLNEQIALAFQTNYGWAIVFLILAYILLILVKNNLTEIEIIEHFRVVLVNLVITALLFLTLLNPLFFKDSVGPIILLCILANILIPMTLTVALGIKLFFPGLFFPVGKRTTYKHQPTQISKITEHKHKEKENHIVSTKWKDALLAIYRNDPHSYGRGKSDFGYNHPLITILKVSPHQLMLILSRLRGHKLIEYDRSEHNWISLTDKGFDVALKIEEIDEKTLFNQLLVLFTGLLAVATFWQVLLNESITTTRQFIIIMSLFLLICLFMNYLHKFKFKRTIHYFN